MPTIPDEAIIYIGWDGRLDGQQILMTTHWKLRYEGGAVDTELADLRDATFAALNLLGGEHEIYEAVLSQDVTDLQFIWQVLYPTRYVRFTSGMGMGEGTVAEDAMPPNVAHVVTVRTDIAGPSQRGNKHIGGVPVTFTEDGHVTAAGVTAYNDLGTMLSTELTVPLAVGDAVYDPVIYDRLTPAGSKLVTNFLLQNTTRVERRRTVGLGS